MNSPPSVSSSHDQFDRNKSPANNDHLAPAEQKLEEAHMLGLSQPVQLKPGWDVERAVNALQEWPEKMEGYKELIFYIAFYTIYCIIQIMQIGPAESYAVNSSLQSVVAGYDSVSSQSDWWIYANGLLSTVFNRQWYNGDAYTTEEDGFVNYYNKLVGGVLIIQERGIQEPCDPSLYTAFYGDCHTDKEATANFTTNSTSFPATFSYTPGIGYSEFFSVAMTQQQVVDMLASLQNQRWLDKNTRGISIKFAVYNGEYELFSFANIHWTFGTGGIMFGNNKADIQSARMEIYKRNDDWGRLFLEILFMYLASWFLCEEIIDFVETAASVKDFRGRVVLSRGIAAYFASAWNYLDMTNHALIVAYIVFRAEYVIYVFRNPIQLPSNKYQTELEEVAMMQQTLLLINILNIFVKILHLFKYFSFQPRMNIIASTVSRAVPDLFHFFILFGCVFLSYCVMALLLFGPYHPMYMSFGLVAQTLGEVILGQFDTVSIRKINPLMATLMFWSYIVLVFFVLTNVFLAILIDAYAESKSQSKDAAGIPEDVGRWFFKLFTSNPRGISRHEDPLKEALVFFQRKGLKLVEHDDIQWFMKEKYGIEDEKFIQKNEGVLRAMQCYKDSEEPNVELNQILQAAWNTYDVDSSGFLDRFEFRNFLKDAPIKIDASQEHRIDAMLQQADTNKDGVISYDEFVPVFHAVLIEGLALSAKQEQAAAKAKAAAMAKQMKYQQQQQQQQQQ